MVAMLRDLFVVIETLVSVTRDMPAGLLAMAGCRL